MISLPLRLWMKRDAVLAPVGHIKVTPSAMNVVAETAEFSIDVRAADKRVIDRIVSRIREELTGKHRKRELLM